MAGSLILAAVVLSIGNAELLVTVINRVHSRPIREHLLQKTRYVHDLLIPLFPVWLVCGVWWPSERWQSSPVTLDVVWSGLPWPVRIYFALCVAGCLGFVWSIVRFQCHRPASQQIKHETRRIDIAAELGCRPVGEGPFRSLTHVPRNECFQIELGQRVLELPHLPQECEGLRILHLSDLHFIGTIDLPYFERLFEHVRSLEFDLAVMTGDMLDDMRLMEWIPRTLGTINARLGKFSILGNHDWLLDPSPIRSALHAAGWVDVASRCELVRCGDAEIAVAGNERPWMGIDPAFDLATTDTFRIALSHSPDNIAWARRERVDLMLSGHNHGGQVVLPVIGPVYSPSLYGCRFAAGVYWLQPTLLCVSRGVSGRHPLRINCLPEVCVLELRRARSRRDE